MRRIIITVTCLCIVFIAANLIYSGYVTEPPREQLPLLQQLAKDNTAFGMDLYEQLRKNDGNLFFSPYSISQSFAMLYAGARGETAEEIANVLHINLSDGELHEAYRAQQLYFDALVHAPKDEKTRINIANELWIQKGFQIQKEYRSLLNQYYKSKPASLNFENDSEGSRRTINTWISNKTKGMISDVLPQGALKTDTQLVLVNTVYFDAKWIHKFADITTRNVEFHRLDNTNVTVPLMRNTATRRYSEGTDWQAVELAYSHRPDMGGMAMLIILPRPGQFQEVESLLDEEFLASIDTTLHDQKVILGLPKFTFTSPSLNMKEILKPLGMESVFDYMKVNLSGINADGHDPLFVDNALHKATITVAEDGTIAAVATAVVALMRGASPEVRIDCIIDRPFMFLIRDLDTKAVLFMGRVLDPKQ